MYQIKYLTGRYDTLAQEINEICSAHVLTLDVDEESRFSYNGADVQDGKLRMLFNDQYLGTNTNDALNESNLFKALNNAPSDKPISFSTRLGIRGDYEPAIGATQKKLAEMLGKPEADIKINPNFEETFAKLTEAKKSKAADLRDDWESALGSYTLKYFEGLAYQMNYQKVGEDDLIQEGFLEAVPSLEFHFRIVDALKHGSGYGEVDIEGEKLYIQTTVDKWGYNIDYVAEKLIDRL